MSNSDDGKEENYFSGFAELFDSLAQEHEDNIFQAIRKYSILQGADVAETNQGVVSSTPHTSPLGIHPPTPQITPINTPIGSPRSNLGTDFFQLARLTSTSSEPGATSNINFSINTFPSRSAHSLQDIHLSDLPTFNRTNISYQAFDRALRAYTKVQKTVVKITEDLRTAIQGNSNEFEVEVLLATLEVEKEDMNEKGKIVNDFDSTQTNPTYKEEEWQDEWNKTNKQ